MPMDPPSFMLASFSMSEANYQLWSGAIVYTDSLLKDQNYDEFSESCLMPPFVEHKDLVWLARNLKLKVTEYSRQLFGPGGYAQGLDGDDDYDPEVTPRVQPRKRHY
ncbi:hypothetical protein SO802_017412 [Lithocarpus litseifolius]|uniref:Retrotransposon Copia-like N-terminal domain-containing protein n=1 Tax=Lithocarpus litseifolius TaxID=425828 RepID=A0AAW2CHW2_9ROSI